MNKAFYFFLVFLVTLIGYAVTSRTLEETREFR